MQKVQYSLSVLARVVAGYVAAVVAAAIAIFALFTVLTIFDTPTAGVTLGEDLLNQVGYLPLVILVTAVLAAPVALVVILFSEIRKMDQWWFFALGGALAAVPALFRGDYMTPSRMAEDFATLGPVGALAGAAYWMVRYRLWPI